MNCEHFSEMIGMRCEPVPGHDGSAVVNIVTPFTFADGDGLEIFAKVSGSHIQFFDDGLTMLHMSSVGLRLNDKRQWRALQQLAKTHDVTMTDHGTFETWAPLDQQADAFARFTSTLLGVAAWEREHRGLPPSAQWLLDEVALHLRAWKPESEVIAEPEAIVGLSGNAYRFDFAIDGELVDAITAHSTATGAELRKLVDIRSNPLHRQQAVRVIVDDRANAAAAKLEMPILGRFATTWSMSALIDAARSKTLLSH